MESQQRIQQIEELVRKIETAADPNMRAAVIELVQSLMELHGAGIERMMEIVSDDEVRGFALIDGLARDELVGSLLLLYGLHPVPLETRVMQGLEKARPFLRSHGGNVELLDITDGAVRLRLQGNCHSCPSSAVTLKLAIEEAIYEVAPDVSELIVEGVIDEQPAPNGFVSIGKLQSKDESPPLEIRLATS